MDGQTEDKTLFRSASKPADDVKEALEEKVKIKDEKVIISKDSGVDPKFSIYSKIKNSPFLVDYYDMGTVYGKFDTENQIEGIEEFILNEIEDRSLNDTTDSAKEILKELEEQLDISENLDIFHKLEKLMAYVKILREQKQIKLTKEKLGVI